MKTKLLLLMLSVFLTSWHVNSQVIIIEGFEGVSAPASWTFNGLAHTSTTPCAGTGAMRVNLYSFVTTAAATSPNQTATGSDINVSLDYKIINWSDGMGTTVDFGVFNLQYSIDGGTNWITYDVIDVASHTPSTVCATRSAVIDAADVPNGSDFIWRIDGTYTTGDYYFYIDDFSAIEQVGCIQPSGLMATMTSVTSEDLSWNENGGATDWNIEYGAPGFTLGSGTPVSTTTNPHSLTGLTTGADYEFYVQSDCGGSQSSWSGPYAFSVSYCEVSTSWPGDYLSSVNSMGALSNITYTATSQPAGSYADETAQSFEAFETMSFDINTSYVGGGNGVNVWVDWNNDLTFDPAELVASLANSDASKTLTVAVPAATPVGDYRMRVRGQYGSTANPPACGNVGHGTTVDFTLTIVAAPSCLPPTDLNTGAMSSTSADLTWTENGSATEWQVEYGAPGFTQGTGTLETATSNPHTITITPDTQYDFYVRSVCGVGDSSYWVGPFNFDNMYCVPSNTYSTSYYINDVITSGAIQNLNNTATGFTAGGYADYTATDTLIVYPGQTIDVTLTHPSSTYGYQVWVDWNNNFSFSDAGENIISTGFESTPLTMNLTVPAVVSQGTYRLRVRNAYLNNPAPNCGSFNYGEAEDYTLVVVAQPSCLPTSDIVASNETQTSIDLDWTENNSATTWNIEYGPEGFTPGTGTTISGVTTNPFTVTGLNPSSTYDFYVQSDCGSGDISSIGSGVTATTLCGAVLAPYYEGFESGELPTCYENLSSNTSSSSTSNFWKFTGQADYGAANNGKAAGTFAWSDGSTPNPDSMMLITTEVDLTPLTTPYLGFEWFSNNTNNPGDNVPLIVSIHDGTSWILLDTLRGDSDEWQFASFDLAAYANTVVKVGFMTNQTTTTNDAFYNDILVDEIRIDDCITGQDGTKNVCRLDGTVDLNDNIVTAAMGGGSWHSDGLDIHLNNSIFEYSTLPSGSYELFYVERFACADTSVATINVYNESTAGDGQSITVCKNEPINLYAALSGNVDIGGDWYDFNGNLLPNSQPTSPSLAAQYNYNYITSNGVCPADTATVEVNVDNCVWLSVEEEEFAEISVYPNPTTSVLNIVNPSNTSSLRIEMLDMNGRVVMVENKALNNATEATLTIDHLEKGIYTLRVYNNEGQRTFKIVKQ